MLPALLLASLPSAADSAAHVLPGSVSLQVLGLTFHPGGGTQPGLYPRKLDEGGWWVAQLGLASAWDVQPWEHLGLRAKAAWYRDCADRPQMFFHLGVRGWMIRRPGWGIQGGLGPTLVLRRSWEGLPGYQGSTFFEPGNWDGWQHKLVWYGGEFDLWKRLSPRWELGASLIPGFPWAFTTLVGARRSL